VDAVASSGAGLCIMHMQGEPKTMQQAPRYDDLLSEVCSFLLTQVNRLAQAGVQSNRIMLDPGLGFGKTLNQNYELLAALPALEVNGLPWLIGLSRKSMIGQITGRDAQHRLAGSLAGMLAAVSLGARVLRVHDVAESYDALAVWAAVQQRGKHERT